MDPLPSARPTLSATTTPGAAGSIPTPINIQPVKPGETRLPITETKPPADETSEPTQEMSEPTEEMDEPAEKTGEPADVPPVNEPEDSEDQPEPEPES